MWTSFRHGADNGKRSSLIFTLISTASFCYILIQSCLENRHCDEMIVRLRQLNLTLVDQSCRFEPVPGNIWIILWCWSQRLMKTKQELKSYSNSKSLQRGLFGWCESEFCQKLRKVKYLRSQCRCQYNGAISSSSVKSPLDYTANSNVRLNYTLCPTYLTSWKILYICPLKL